MTAQGQSTKPTTGKLIYVSPSGNTRLLEQNKPFALLQTLKKNYIMQGFKKEYLKITY